ncbi:hypothetical protein QUA52_16040, partial [Microcoleus sp. N9_A3]
DISRDSWPKLIETRFLRVRNWRYQVGENLKDRTCQARNRVSWDISRDSWPKLIETRFLRVRNWRYQVGGNPIQIYKDVRKIIFTEYLTSHN